MNLHELSLTMAWRCDYFELDPDLFEFMDSVNVPSLTAWTFERRFAEDWAAWLERTFNLLPLEACVNYILRIDQAPTETRLILNGRDFGIIQAPLELNVTDFVTLDDNRIAFRVECSAEGRFGQVTLRAVPCAES